jgi:uncharacterized protein YndB with AHSA1/START domain
MARELKAITVELEIPIRAGRERVWNALVSDIDLWWRKDFLVTKAKRFVLEPRLGGRMYEDAGEGTGITWYNVQGITPNESLLLAGFLYPGYGGPATTLLQLTLEESGKETILRIKDAIFGELSDDAESAVGGGWRALFGDGLKRFVEK